jgi:hypothetical protein
LRCERLSSEELRIGSSVFVSLFAAEIYWRLYKSTKGKGVQESIATTFGPVAVDDPSMDARARETEQG